MKRAEDLRRILEAIDRKSYPAYKDTRGGYRFGSYSLFIEHVQGDPFATPSRVSVLVDGGQAGFPEELYREKTPQNCSGGSSAETVRQKN